MVEANQFQAMVTSFFTLPIALALMLLSMVSGLRFLDAGRLRHAVMAGLLALVLAAVHPYDIVTLLAVLAVWTLLRPVADRAKLDQRAWLGRIAGMWLVPAIASPYLIYSLLITRSDPVLSQVKWFMPVPGILPHVLGYGLPLLLTVIALTLPTVWRHNRQVLLLAAWLALAVVLLMLPISFRRKLIWGAHVPMCLLAAMGAVAFWRGLVRQFVDGQVRQITGVAAAAVLVVVCGIGSAVFYAGLFQRNERHSFGDYLPDEYVKALDWLSEHHQPGDVVLAGPRLTAMVPGRTGCTVFYGHWAQTLDRPGKMGFVQALFGPPGRLPLAAVKGLLARNRVHYVVLDAGSMNWQRGVPRQLPAMTFLPLTKVAFVNPLVVILAIQEFQPRSDSRPWTSGDWQGSEDVPAAP